MKIYTSYFAKAKELAARGIRCVSIARYTPRWFSGSELKFLAPSSALLFDKSLTDKEWEERYAKEVLEHLDVRLLAQTLWRMSNGKDIALLCYEKPCDECHRHVLARWMNGRGYDVKEYDWGDRMTKSREKMEHLEELSLFD